MQSTIPGLSFDADAVGGLLTTGGYEQLEYDLGDGRMKLWVWLEGADEVQAGFLYVLEGEDDAHVYCVGSADVRGSRVWTLSGLRDLGTCRAATAIDGSLDACVESRAE